MPGVFSAGFMTMTWWMSKCSCDLFIPRVSLPDAYWTGHRHFIRPILCDSQLCYPAQSFSASHWFPGMSIGPNRLFSDPFSRSLMSWRKTHSTNTLSCSLFPLPHTSLSRTGWDGNIIAIRNCAQ